MERSLDSIQLLDHLIAFPTVSRDSNLELIHFVGNWLETRGVRCRLVHSEDRRKANLFAAAGPSGTPGVLLSGHTDVVPVDGQNWSTDPFRLTAQGDRLMGRGTADMKGFLACAMRAAALAAKRELRTPLWLAFSYDEEIGCIGVRRLIDVMVEDGLRPLCCVVGEPTSMKVATGHKGKTALRAVCRGEAAHSAFAPRALNALHLACDFVGLLRDLQRSIEISGPADPGFEIPCTTVHAAKISGGVAANIVPDEAAVEFEIRNVAADDPASLLAGLRAGAQELEQKARRRSKAAGISIQVINSYPGLDTDPDSSVAAFVKSLTGGNATSKVAFGTEAGLFSERVGTPSVICGPGSMEQGHKADEFVSRHQLERCDLMMSALLTRLEAGISLRD